jgi:hypothetical protein
MLEVDVSHRSWRMEPRRRPVASASTRASSVFAQRVRSSSDLASAPSCRIAFRVRVSRSQEAIGRTGFCSRSRRTPASGFTSSRREPLGSRTVVARDSIAWRSTRSISTERARTARVFSPLGRRMPRALRRAL